MDPPIPVATAHHATARATTRGSIPVASTRHTANATSNPAIMAPVSWPYWPRMPHPMPPAAAPASTACHAMGPRDSSFVAMGERWDRGGGSGQRGGGNEEREAGGGKRKAGGGWQSFFGTRTFALPDPRSTLPAHLPNAAGGRPVRIRRTSTASIPAETIACIPRSVSSKARHRMGSTRMRAAASRKMSGAGF